MAATDFPGLTDVAAAAQALGIDVTATVQKARMLMQTDPTTVRTGGERLGTVAGGLTTGQDDIRRAGTGVLTAGMTGQFTDAFGPHHAGLMSDVADTSAAAKQLAGELGHIATVFQGSQETVVKATGATATALRMLAI
jgi:hypothetical protein